MTILYDNIIKLVSVTETNNNGCIQEATTEKEVYAELKSIGFTEFYQAQAVGAKPEIKFVLPDYLDYSGEQRIKYTDYVGTEGEYQVIRTYRTGNELEIVCKRGIG